MEFHKYNGQDVTVQRVYKVGDETLVDVRNPQTGDVYQAVSIEDIDHDKSTATVQETPHKISFKHRKFGETILVEDSDEYRQFVAEENLNPVFIDNCLKGISKTHKGYVISYAD